MSQISSENHREFTSTLKTQCPHICPKFQRPQSLTSVVHIVDDMEFVLHRSAVSTAEAAGEEEEEERRGCRQPAAHRDPETDVSRSAGQHDAGSSKALPRTGMQVSRDFLSWWNQTWQQGNNPDLEIWWCKGSWLLFSIHDNSVKLEGKPTRQQLLLTLNFGKRLRSVSRGPMLLLRSRRAQLIYSCCSCGYCPMNQGRQSPSVIPVHGMHHLLLSSYSSHSLKPPILSSPRRQKKKRRFSFVVFPVSDTQQRRPSQSRWHADNFNLVNMGGPGTTSRPVRQWNGTVVGGFFFPFFH